MSLYAFVPQHDKGLKHAIDECFEFLPNDTDWAILQDRDVFWFQADFKKWVKSYIDAHPSVSLFTTYASRCSYDYQMLPDAPRDHDVRSHYQFAKQQESKVWLLKDLKANVSGHVIVMQKKQWMAMRGDIFATPTKKQHHILGVDTLISKWLINRGLRIGIMEAIYVYHYFRSHSSRHDVSHIITPQPPTPK